MRIAFHVADRPRADPSPLGQLLLGEARREPQPSQQRPESSGAHCDYYFATPNPTCQGIGERSSWPRQPEVSSLEGMEMTRDEIKVGGRRITEELFNQGDLAVVAELFDPAYVQYLVPEDRMATVEEIVATVAELRRSFPDLHARIEQQVVEGNTLVQRLSVTGSRSARTFSALAAATDNALRIGVLDIYRIGPDSKFTQGWTFWDARSCARGAVAPGHGAGRSVRRQVRRGSRRP